MPKISACIVAYCDYDEVCAAVRSILHYTPAPDLALYVVDNGSPDGCGRQLAETDFGDSRVTVLPLEKNIGFGNGPRGTPLGVGFEDHDFVDAGHPVEEIGEFIGNDTRHLVPHRAQDLGPRERRPDGVAVRIGM